MSNPFGGIMLQNRLKFTHLCIGLLFIALFSVSGSAQFRAGVRGTVMDTGGGTVAGATVTLTSKETNQSQQTTTSDQGFYQFTGLPPGLYTVTVEQSGFKKSVVNDVKLDAEAISGVDVTLNAGVISEVVTVQAETVELQTEDA